MGIKHGIGPDGQSQIWCNRDRLRGTGPGSNGTPAILSAARRPDGPCDKPSVPAEFREGLPWWGGAVDALSHHHTGALKAFDPATSQEVWSWRSEYRTAGSVLATAGNLVFAGEADGHFNAWDARTGELLWRFNTGSGIHSSPVTYRRRGKQYVAVPSGWGGWLAGIAPMMMGASRADALFVFALV